MEKKVITCDACKEEIHDVTAVMALGIRITSGPSMGDNVVVTFTPQLAGADKHACGIKCAIDVIGKELLRLRANVT